MALSDGGENFRLGSESGPPTPEFSLIYAHTGNGQIAAVSAFRMYISHRPFFNVGGKDGRWEAGRIGAVLHQLLRYVSYVGLIASSFYTLLLLEKDWVQSCS
jgi:hypothetical protein